MTFNAGEAPTFVLRRCTVCGERYGLDLSELTQPPEPRDGWVCSRCRRQQPSRWRTLFARRERTNNTE